MRRVLLVSFLFACAEEPAGVGVVWEDGAALPEDALTPPGLTLAATPFVPGQLLSLQATGAPAGTTVWFVRSATAGVFCPPALGGACVSLANPAVVGTAVANAQGLATLSISPPAAIPVGTVMRFQAAVVNPATVSNVAVLTAASVCGDGVLQTDEGCDDGNLAPGDGCDDVCLVEVSQDSFRVYLNSAQITANDPRGGVWDAFALVPPFTNPDVYVQVELNNVYLARTATDVDTIRPVWNASTVVDVYPGDTLTFTLFDEEPAGLGDELLRTFSFSRQRLDGMRNTGPVDVSGGPVRRFTIEVTDP